MHRDIRDPILNRRLSEHEHAPEIFGTQQHTVAVDIWSMGYLIKQAMESEWRALGQEQSDFLDLSLAQIEKFKAQYERRIQPMPVQKKIKRRKRR